jgi:hypothetical protein
MSPEGLPVPAALASIARRSFAMGAVFMLALAVGLVLDRAQFFRSYLFAFVFWLGIAVGCLGLAMLNQLTGGLWGIVPRRLHEAAARTIPFMGLAFVPVVLGIRSLYVWAGPEAASDANIQSKAVYLNVPFFVARAVFYFLAWSLLASLLSRWSLRQDQQADPARAERLQGLSGIGLVLLSLTTTFAAFDWGMSLAPHWFSTMYGVLYIVGWTLSALAFTIVVMALLSSEPPFDAAVAPITFQDLGKLLLTFTMLWAYVNFSQFLIIWSGNLTSETPFYVRRLQGGWAPIAVVLLLFHFALPFALLLSRPLKRSARALAAVALLMLVVRLLDHFWLVGPDLIGRGGLAVPLRVHWMDLAATLGIGGLWLALFAWQARTRPALPLGDPALRERLAGRAEGAEA